MEETRCSNCKHCRDLNGCYCYCAKRNYRVRIADRTNCNKFVKKEKIEDGGHSK